MIKFFRTIRKSLLMENKTSKYFKYAIGEIILVVIGILIALSINNWNQNQNRLKKETILLQQLKVELISIFKDVYSDLAQLRQAEKSHYKIIDHIDENLDYKEELAFDFDFLKEDEYIYPETAVYNKIKDEGLDIIQNDSIRNNVQILYETIFPRISRGLSFHPDISEYLDEFYTTNFKVNKNYNITHSFIIEKESISDTIFPSTSITYPMVFVEYGKTRQFTLGYIPLDFEDLKKNNEFYMLLAKADDYRYYKITWYEYAKTRIKNVVAFIDKELEN